MSAEDRAKYWDEYSKLGPARREEERIGLERERNGLEADRIALEHLRLTQPKELDKDSGRIYDPKLGYMRNTEPGEVGLTNRQLKQNLDERRVNAEENRVRLQAHRYNAWKHKLLSDEKKKTGPTANQVVGWLTKWDKVPDNMKVVTWELIKKGARDAGVGKDLVPDEMPQSASTAAKIGRNLRSAGVFIGGLTAPSTYGDVASGLAQPPGAAPPTAPAPSGLPGAPSEEVAPPGGIPQGYRSRRLPNGATIWEPE